MSASDPQQPTIEEVLQDNRDEAEELAESDKFKDEEEEEEEDWFYNNQSFKT